MRKKREPKSEPPRRTGLCLAVLTFLALGLSLVLSYLFGSRWVSWMGTAGMLWTIAWLGLTPLAVVMLVLDVLHAKRRALLIVRGAVLLVPLIGAPLQLPLEGPGWQDIAFQRGLQQRLESKVAPRELQSLAAELVSQHRAAKDKTASFRDEASMKALPGPIRELQPEAVVVEVSSDTVTLSWPRRFGWALDVSPRGLRYRSEAEQS